MTDNTGVYQFLQMMPGEYTLAVTKPGFSKATQEHVVLQVNVPARVDAMMQLDKQRERTVVARGRCSDESFRQLLL